MSQILKSLRSEQKKYGIFLCGGDTTYSNRLSFSITSIGYSKKIIYRNNSKLNDDIYVTGNLGDSFVGLQILKSKIKFKKQINVVEDIASQISDGNNSLRGVMLESHLVEGNQSISDNLVYGQSITDACMNWDDTLNCLKLISEAVQKRRE